jgi:subtilase family serine protease
MLQTNVWKTYPGNLSQAAKIASLVLLSVFLFLTCPAVQGHPGSLDIGTCPNQDLPRSPDIALKEIKLVPASPAVLETPVVKVVVANVGTEGIPAVGLSFLWKLSKQGDNRPIISQACSTNLEKLLPGETREIAAEYINFRLNEAGTYKLEIQALLADSLYGLEKKLDDNSNSLEFTVIPGEKPDLVITGIQLNPANPGKNSPFWIEAVVKNAGKGALTYIPARIRVTRNGVVVKEGADGASSLFAANSTMTARILISAGLDAGKYQIDAAADPDGKIDETDETNNGAIKDFEIPEQGGTNLGIPDLALKEIKLVPASPAVLETPAVKVVVANIGTGEIPAVGLSFLWKLSKPGDSRPIISQACSTNLDKLVSGETREIPAEYINFRLNEAGTYKLEIQALLTDSLYGLEKKLDDNTNSLEFTVIPGGKPDLVISEIKLDPPSPVKNSPFWIEAVVKNAGKGSISYMSARIRVTRNGVMVKEGRDGGSSLFATNATMIARILIGDGLDAGTYRVEAVADAENQTDESDENNNSLTRDIAIAEASQSSSPRVPQLKIRQSQPKVLDNRVKGIVRPLFSIPTGYAIEIQFAAAAPIEATLLLKEIPRMLGTPPQAYTAEVESSGKPVFELGSFGNGKPLPLTVKVTVAQNNTQVRQANKLALVIKILDTQKREVYGQTITLTVRK